MMIPMIKVPLSIYEERILSLKLLVFDFDGVFTDNAVMVDENGLETVKCSRCDGLGLRKAESVGLELLILSSEKNIVVTERSKKLEIPCIRGCSNKRAALESLLADKGINLAEVAFMGNDLNDADCLKIVGLPIVTADAHNDVVPLALWQTDKAGGNGAVREVCDAIHEVRSGKR